MGNELTMFIIGIVAILVLRGVCLYILQNKK